MRRRIVSLSVLAAMLAISLFGLPLAAGAARYYLADERGELERTADQATISVSADLLRGRDTAELAPTESGIVVGLYNTAGRRIGGDGPPTADAAVRGALNAEVTNDESGGDLVVAVPVASEEHVVAVVRAASPRIGVYQQIVSTWLLMLAMAVVAVAVTWLLARRQARRLALPIERLAKAASRLGEGDFSVRTRPSGIPEIDSAAACLDVTAERLGDLITRERAFSAEASHQLRTPLTGLKLRLEAALDDPSADLSQVITEVDRLEDTIADLLSLARDTPRRSQPLDLRTLMTEIERTWHGELAAQARPLRIKIGADLPGCLASTAAVRQILAVLVDNAVRHGAGIVTVAVREANDALAVDVIDDGDLTGVDVFSGRSMRAGHGIGLPMARRLAEAEGGRLSLTAVKPTTFSLLLPGDQSIVGGS